MASVLGLGRTISAPSSPLTQWGTLTGSARQETKTSVIFMAVDKDSSRLLDGRCVRNSSLGITA
jgi:hypothetical protein